jgi:hypothetical protein
MIKQGQGMMVGQHLGSTDATKTPGMRAASVNYDYLAIGENFAFATENSLQVLMKALEDSPCKACLLAGWLTTPGAHGMRASLYSSCSPLSLLLSPP